MARGCRYGPCSVCGRTYIDFHDTVSEPDTDYGTIVDDMKVGPNYCSQHVGIIFYKDRYNRLNRIIGTRIEAI